MKSNNLVKNKKYCCGCGLCMSKCPKKAISMVEDETGFLFPKIDESKCVDCHVCVINCPYQNNNNNVSEEPYNQQCFLAYNKNFSSLMNSSSGGVFGALAENFINSGGIVYGCSMEYKEKLIPKHIRVNNLNDLEKLKGSKYVQSSIFETFSLIKDDLINNKNVLFSGTPCQVAAVKKATQNIKSGNLYTIDIICHGTPSVKLFQDYISVLEKKLNGKIYNFVFRDKSIRGTGFNVKIFYKDKNGKKHIKFLPSILSSYYDYFLKYNIYRENCYSCKYASKNRVGDITIGDYWGAELEHPEFMKNNGGKIDIRNGVSCLLVNSNKGEELFKKYKNDLIFFESSFDKIAAHNGQLNAPSVPKGNRLEILNDYEKYGYEYINDKFEKNLSLKNKLKMYVPTFVYKIKRKFK